jgi:hypothetical protein
MPHRTEAFSTTKWAGERLFYLEMEGEMNTDWYRLMGLGVVTVAAMASMGHFLAHMLVMPF